MYFFCIVNYPVSEKISMYGENFWECDVKCLMRRIRQNFSPLGIFSLSKYFKLAYLQRMDAVCLFILEHVFCVFYLKEIYMSVTTKYEWQWQWSTFCKKLNYKKERHNDVKSKVKYTFIITVGISICINTNECESLFCVHLKPCVVKCKIIFFTLRTSSF